jgi:hypothetical protein
MIVKDLPGKGQGDFFRLFWASWNEVFTSKNISSAFEHTSLYFFNPETVIQKFNKKIESRPSSSGSTTSITPAEEWRRLEKLVKTVVTDIYDQEAMQLKDTVLHLSTENVLLRNEIEGLQE